MLDDFEEFFYRNGYYFAKIEGDEDVGLCKNKSIDDKNCINQSFNSNLIEYNEKKSFKKQTIKDLEVSQIKKLKFSSLIKLEIKKYLPLF